MVGSSQNTTFLRMTLAEGTQPRSARQTRKSNIKSTKNLNFPCRTCIRRKAPSQRLKLLNRTKLSILARHTAQRNLNAFKPELKCCRRCESEAPSSSTTLTPHSTITHILRLEKSKELKSKARGEQNVGNLTQSFACRREDLR